MTSAKRLHNGQWLKKKASHLDLKSSFSSALLRGATRRPVCSQSARFVIRQRVTGLLEGCKNAGQEETRETEPAEPAVCSGQKGNTVSAARIVAVSCCEAILRSLSGRFFLLSSYLRLRRIGTLQAARSYDGWGPQGAGWRLRLASSFLTFSRQPDGRGRPPSRPDPHFWSRCGLV